MTKNLKIAAIIALLLTTILSVTLSSDIQSTDEYPYTVILQGKGPLVTIDNGRTIDSECQQRQETCRMIFDRPVIIIW